MLLRDDSQWAALHLPGEACKTKTHLDGNITPSKWSVTWFEAIQASALPQEDRNYAWALAANIPLMGWQFEIDQKIP